jgi:hypothetical protein
LPNSAELSSERDVRGDLICTQCARVAGTVQGANGRGAKVVALRVQDPLRADAVRRLTCPDCAGRLWLQNREEVPLDPLRFDREALRPQRGRRPTVVRVP